MSRTGDESADAPRDESPADEPTPIGGTGVALVGRGGSMLDRLLDATMVASGLVILAVALGVTFNVLSRQYLGRSYTRVFEWSEYAMLYLTFLAVAGIARDDGHVRMEVIDEFLPARVLKYLNVATDVLGIVIALLLVGAGTWVAHGAYEAGTVIGILRTPRWIVLAIVPAGSVLLVIQQLRSLVLRIRQVT